MSAPAFAWALERGATLALRPSDRLVLLDLRGHGERFQGVLAGAAADRALHRAEEQHRAGGNQPAGCAATYTCGGNAGEADPVSHPAPRYPRKRDWGNPRKPAQGTPRKRGWGTPLIRHRVPP